MPETAQDWKEMESEEMNPCTVAATPVRDGEPSQSSETHWDGSGD